MAKTIRVNYNGKDYVLEYTRESVETMEKRGFVLGDLASRPMSTLPELFSGAFLAHHKFLPEAVINDLFKKMTDKENLYVKLIEMYNETIETLLSTETDPDGKNATWGANWD